MIHLLHAVTDDRMIPFAAYTAAHAVNDILAEVYAVVTHNGFKHAGPDNPQNSPSLRGI